MKLTNTQTLAAHDTLRMYIKDTRTRHRAIRVLNNIITSPFTTVTAHTDRNSVLFNNALAALQVCWPYITEAELRSKSRKRELVEPRQVFCYILRGLPASIQPALKDIGYYLGGRDHSTVIHGRDAVTDQMQVDKKLKEKVNITVEALAELNAHA